MFPSPLLVCCREAGIGLRIEKGPDMSGIMLSGNRNVEAPKCWWCGYAMKVHLQPNKDCVLFICQGFVGCDKPCVEEALVCTTLSSEHETCTFWARDARNVETTLVRYARSVLGENAGHFGFPVAAPG